MKWQKISKLPQSLDFMHSGREIAREFRRESEKERILESSKKGYFQVPTPQNGTSFPRKIVKYRRREIREICKIIDFSSFQEIQLSTLWHFSKTFEEKNTNERSNFKDFLVRSKWQIKKEHILGFRKERNKLKKKTKKVRHSPFKIFCCLSLFCLKKPENVGKM